MRSNGTKPAPVVVDDYNAKVDRKVLEQMERADLTGDELNKAIANAIRWAAIKSKIVLSDHGSGFLDPEED
jgi:hypothetical protein